MNKYISLKQQYNILLEETKQHQPIIAYHGITEKDYKTYLYTYYTTDINYAKKFARSGKIRKAEINIKNPFVIQATYMGYGEIIFNDQIIGFYRELNKNTASILTQNGHDGIIVNYKGIIGFEIIPFFDYQIKELEIIIVDVD